MRTARVFRSRCRAVSVALAICLTAVAGCETNPGYSFFTLNASAPVGATRSYVKTPGWRGVGIDAWSPSRGPLSFGYSVSWNQLIDRSDDVILLPKGAVSGLHTSTLSTMPILVGAQYRLRAPDDSINHTLVPFVGLLTGVYYSERRSSLGWFVVGEQEWRFGVAPRIGVTKRMGDLVRIIADVRYNYTPGTAPGCSYLSFGAGFAWVVD